ncbi:MAG: DUF484 family protein [Pseudomonadales bacterium]
MSEPIPISRQAEIIEYLRQDPDFFQRHPALLAELNLPHQSGNAVSLVERQVALLRERNIDMRRRMHELVSAAKENDVLFSKIRSLTLALLDVASWHELNEIFATYFLVDFQADFVCCHLHSAGPASLHREALGLTLNHIRTDTNGLPQPHLQPESSPKCVTLRGDELASLFPGQTEDAADSGSAVLIPLNIGPDACLAVGSRNPSHFSADQDTLFVEYISDVTSHVVARLMR